MKLFPFGREPAPAEPVLLRLHALTDAAAPLPEAAASPAAPSPAGPDGTTGDAHLRAGDAIGGRMPRSATTGGHTVPEDTVPPPPAGCRTPQDPADLPPAARGRSAPLRPGVLPVVAERLRGLRARLPGDELDPGRPGVRALVGVGMAAALLAGGLWWRSRPVPQPVAPPAASVSLLATPTVPASPTGAGSVVVDVAGKVRHPGVFTLPAGSRVVDAIRAAGGARPGADTSTLNLARRLTDGEQILVGVPGTSGLGAGPADGASTPGAVLDLNAASVEQLETLPGIGPVLAQRIVEHREQHGPFRSVDELREVTGIGERKFADIKDRVRA